jgi:hypothetical protein
MYKISVRASLTAGGGPYGIPAGSYGAFGLRFFDSCAAAISVRDLIGYGLTGVWSADDGGFYYVRQEGQRIWWGGFSGELGLQVGLAFCNVFQGSIAGIDVEGSWADVPRGLTHGLGELSFTVQRTAGGIPFILNKTAGTGGFSASTWTFKRWYFGTYNYTFTDLFKQITKNTYVYDTPTREKLWTRLRPLKEQTVVVFGALGYSGSGATTTFDNSFTQGQEPTWDNFWAMNYPLDLYGSDADMDTYMVVEINELPPDFFDGVSPEDVGTLIGFINVGYSNPILTELPAWESGIETDLITLHPEVIMFGAAVTDVPTLGGITQVGPPVPLLPGWGLMQLPNETGVLINGRPINGEIVRINEAVITIGGINPAFGGAVRISGVFTNDTGHGGIKGGQTPEIHPVFTIDVINTTGPADLTGTWGISDGGTCYMRQIGTTIWFLWLRPLFDVTLATTFTGTLAGKVISGKWADVPFGDRRRSGDLTLTVSGDNIRMASTTALFSTLIWRKLYDGDSQQ